MLAAVHRSKAEDVKDQIPQFDANFEERLKGLKQQGLQKLSVSSLFPLDTSCHLYFIHLREIVVWGMAADSSTHKEVWCMLKEVKREVSTTENDRNLYDNPPPLTQTLFGSKDKKADGKEPASFFNQAALTVGSLLLIGVFVVVSGGSDLANLAAPQRTAPQVCVLGQSHPA